MIELYSTSYIVHTYYGWGRITCILFLLLQKTELIQMWYRTHGRNRSPYVISMIMASGSIGTFKAYHSCMPLEIVKLPFNCSNFSFFTNFACSFNVIIFRKLFQLLFFDIRSVTKNISFCLEVSEVPSCSILIQY
jgi:hypothetical protein